MKSCVISIVNQKGGVAKTTTSLAIATASAQQNKDEKILLIDLDSQKSASSVLLADDSYEQDNLNESIYMAFKSGKISSEQIHSTKLDNLFLIPASLNLIEVESMLTNKLDGFHKLDEAMEGLRKEFSMIICDCPPNLSMITINAMVASRYLIVPLQSSKFSLDGIQSILDSLTTIRRRYNPSLSILGAVMTMYDKRTTLSRVMLEEIEKILPLFKIKIPKSVLIEEAHLLKKSIYEHASNSSVAIAYRALTKEILNGIR